MINQQACAITKMYPSKTIAALKSEAKLTPALILKGFCQRKYACRILSFYNFILAKDILPAFFQVEDKDAQPEDQLETNLI